MWRYAYSDSPNFEILLLAYAFDEEPTRISDLACGEKLPQKVLDALEDPTIKKQHSMLSLSAPVFPVSGTETFSSRNRMAVYRRQSAMLALPCLWITWVRC